MAKVSADTIQIVLGCMGFGGWLFFSAIKSHRRARHMADTPRSKAVSAPNGFVELEGFAWPEDKTFESQVGVESVYYSFTLQREETRGSGKNRRKVWVTVYSFSHADRFFLVDATGLVVIDPRQAELNLDAGHSKLWRSLSQKEKDRILTTVIKGDMSGFPPSNFLFGLFGGKYRVIENEIRVGSPVYASGHFTSTEGGAFGVKGKGLTHFAKKVFSGPTGTIKDMSIVLDTNRDGKVSVKEAKEGYSIAAKMARLKNESATGAAETDFALHGSLTSSPSHKLFVADAFEEHVRNRITSMLWVKLGGGAAAIALGVALAFGIDPLEKNQSAPIVGRLPAAQAAQPLPKTPPIEKAQARPVASQEAHAECVRGNALFCEILIRDKDQWNLSEQHVSYYKAQACKAGRTHHCK